jgi:hypothetical protein
MNEMEEGMNIGASKTMKLTEQRHEERNNYARLAKQSPTVHLLQDHKDF